MVFIVVLILIIYYNNHNVDHVYPWLIMQENESLAGIMDEFELCDTGGKLLDNEVCLWHVEDV